MSGTTQKRTLTALKRFIVSKTAAMILLFILLSAAFAIISKGIFIKPKNLVNILSSMAISAFLTEGVALLMISGKLDLSTGASGTLCGMFLAYILRAGFPLIPALVVTIVLGAVIGFINALVVNSMDIAPFIATLATSSVMTGFIYLIANKKTIDVSNPVLKYYGKGMLFDYVPVSALVAFAAMVVIGIILHKTEFGRNIYLVGGNPTAAMLAGVNPKKMSYILFSTCGFFSALAGITLVSRLQSASITGISAQRFQGITAAVLGGISFGGGSGGMAGAFVGLLILSTFSNGLTVIGVSPHWQNVASGLLLLFALTLDVLNEKRITNTVA
ncbi:MAG: ABC transporter permease [Oscillospiraceae bacterium]|jgi:ribose/xylose/arabinose/galactoside ABC-type transport system permease subunit|nr:ABC transporter permease [Oscillospiraceae bacterium]